MKNNFENKKATITARCLMLGRAFWETTKNHYGAITCSLFLTILIFAPLLFFPAVIKNEYQGINFTHIGTDVHLYLTRGKEVLDGYGLGSMVLKEGKNDQDQFFSYSDQILLAPIKLLGLAQKVDIVSVYNVYNFIGIFLLILLIYSLVLQLSGNKLLAIAASLFVVGGYSIIYFKTLFYNDFNVYTRLIYPYFSSLVVFSYLNLLVKSLKSDKLRYKIYSGLVFGLLFHIYFFAWSFALTLNASLFLIFILKKDYSSIKKVLFITLMGLALGAYNLFKLFLLFGSEAGKQLSYFQWMSYGHLPIFSKIGFISLLLAAVFWYKRKNDKNLSFILAVILSGWIVLNQQIITGRMLQYGHYYWYFIVPLSIIIDFYMIWFLIKSETLKKFLFIFLIAIAFINTAGGQYKSFFTTLEVKKYEQNYRPFIDFLNTKKEPSVILAGDEANEYLFTIYTSHDLFYHTAALYSHAPIQRLKDALFVFLYLNKESRNNAENYLLKISDNKAVASYCQGLYRSLEGYLSGLSYYDYTYKIATDDRGLNQKRLEIISQLSQEYEKTVLENNGIDGLLKKYEANYIVWDKNKNSEWDLGEIQGLEQVASHNNIYLYELR